jgi:hypothetical protein
MTYQQAEVDRAVQCVHGHLEIGGQANLAASLGTDQRFDCLGPARCEILTSKSLRLRGQKLTHGGSSCVYAGRQLLCRRPGFQSG